MRFLMFYLVLSSQFVRADDSFEKCSKFWEELKEFDLSSISYSARPLKSILPRAPKCSDLNRLFTSLHSQYLATCDSVNWNRTASKRDWQRGVQPCLHTAYVYQAQLQSLDLPSELSQVQEPEPLKKALLALIMRAQYGMSFSTEELRGVANRMREVAPEDAGASKLVAFATVLPLLAIRQGAPEKSWEEALSTHLHAEKLSPQDLSLAELGIFLQSHGLHDLTQVERQALRLEERFSASGVGLYYLAYVSWKKNDLEKAQDFLRQAIQIQPHEERFQETLSVIQRQQPGRKRNPRIKPFHFNLSLLLSEGVEK